MQPFQFQEDVANKIVDHFEKSDRALLQSATASGKTFISAMVIQRMQQKTLFIVNKQALVQQAYNTITAMGMSCAVLHNDIKRNIDGTLFNTDLNSDVVITMVETFHNQPKDVQEALKQSEFLVIDEAHKATSNSYQELRKMINIPVLGLTATPGRVKNKEGESLEDWYGSENLFTTVGVRELIRIGRLVPPEYMVFNEEDHVVNTWKKVTQSYTNKRTIVFGESTKHILKLRESFQSEGIRAEVITTSDEEESATAMTPNQRAEVYRKFREGEIDVLISINALCEGFDEPQAHFCFLCRRVGSGNIPFFHQIVGRVLRAAEGKTEGIVVDFRDNVQRFGPIEDFDWDEIIEGKQTSMHVGNGEQITENTWQQRERIHTTCSSCNHVYDIKKNDTCTYCNTPHAIERVTTVQELKDRLYTSLTESERAVDYLLKITNSTGSSATKKTYKKKLATANTVFSRRQAFVGVLDKLKTARDRNMGLQMNNMLGVDIFENESEFASEFKYLESLLDINYKDATVKSKVTV